MPYTNRDSGSVDLIVESFDMEADARLSLTIDNPTSKGVAIVDLEFLNIECWTPNHWRAGKWDKPPLDIAVSPDAGQICSIQFVFQDECTSLMENPDDLELYNGGIPVVDLSPWSDDRYHDVHRDVQAFRTESDCLVLSLGSGVVNKFVCSQDLSVGLGSNSELLKLYIGPLSESDWSLIKRADTSDDYQC
ncbi:hypothetical protein [Haloechinothrix sp. LS1_15]|uniref:hypothetical protein n=1 Tax=Haloechinothrix sp. LS1_15 TaxID=2652248 RepID=UPI0029472F44|nr:hypothetical protein [Haloechinothrix sp. LS1_15]MDV6014778.1 hypothetical protein [Haloechinothrix sp. LS1_15]